MHFLRCSMIIDHQQLKSTGKTNHCKKERNKPTKKKKLIKYKLREVSVHLTCQWLDLSNKVFIFVTMPISLMCSDAKGWYQHSTGILKKNKTITALFQIKTSLHDMMHDQAAAIFLEFPLLKQDFSECLIWGTACSVFWMAVGEEPLAWPVANKLHGSWDVKETWQLQHSESRCSGPCRSSQSLSGVSTSIDKYVLDMITIPVYHKPK